MPVYLDFTEREAHVKLRLCSREWPMVLMVLVANSNIHCNKSKSEHNICSASSNASDITDSLSVFSTVLFPPRYFLAFPEDKNRLKPIRKQQRTSCLPTRRHNVTAAIVVTRSKFDFKWQNLQSYTEYIQKYRKKICKDKWSTLTISVLIIGAQDCFGKGDDETFLRIVEDFSNSVLHNI